ncbi:helix-turn-helix transcriptional regulator [Actinomadura fulvescens]|uniref:Helix-turn-helix transcriptional regulator n=2 Tax=Actinomadura fulvescens TaxID=46160 RepID=A0ABP6BWL1_9ACTN
MQEPSFLILTVLAAEAQHGYAIMTEVTDISGGRVKLRPGTLYAALDRLREEGLVEVDREEVVDTRLRRYYRITATGAERLAVEADRMRRNADSALQRLATGGRRLAGGTS